MIELKDVSFVYSGNSPYETTALYDINLSIGEGEFVGVIGQTGSGKSTLVNIISGILKPTSGKILIDGEDITEMKAVAKTLKGKIGLVFQYPEYQLFEETVREDIAYGPKNMGLSKEDVEKRVCEAAKMVSLSDEILDKSPFEISGGEKRRAAIAGILSIKPKILILDEPTAGLDPFGRKEILGQIKKMHSEYGITVILVSHNMEEIAEVCEKVVVISEGHIVKYLNIDEIFLDSDSLKEYGLDVPFVTEIMTELKKAGIPVRNDIYRMDDAISELVNALSGGEGK